MTHLQMQKPRSISLSRRELLAAGAAAAVGGAFSLPTARAAEGPYQGTLKKALIVGEVTGGLLAPLKRAGFDGVETTHIVSEAQCAQGAAAAKAQGMRVHSVLVGWMEFNSADPAAVEASIEKVRLSIRAAQAYEADTVLVVPCRAHDVAVPNPWDFDIDFNEKTGHVTRVVKGDNSKWEPYIAVQNRATDTSRAAVEKLIPYAEQHKIIIGLENVWNDLWVTPELYNNFVSSFNSPWARPYFDIGNVVKYSPPERWIKVLGPKIVKLHFKDFKLNPDGHGGGWVHLPDGSVNWKAVRKALDEDAHYNGWGSIEEVGLSPAEYARRFDAMARGE